MAKSSPLYTIEEQYIKLSEDLPSSLSAISTIKYRLLVACSNRGTLPQAKNKFLNLIQDTEIRTIFSSLLEVPEFKVNTGVKSIQAIHTIFGQHYGKFPKALKELRTLGVPQYTIRMLGDYFYANEDPVYKLSIMAAVVMLAYIKDDEINNRK